VRARAKNHKKGAKKGREQSDKTIKSEKPVTLPYYQGFQAFYTVQKGSKQCDKIR
jgi:hypothetical protein